MSQYKGKREDSGFEKSSSEKKGASGGSHASDDPFSGAKLTAGERLENFFLDVGWFFRSRKGKVLVTVLCGLIVMGVCGAALLNNLIQPPSIDPGNGGDGGNGGAIVGPENPKPNPDNGTGQENVPPDDLPPSDDELYPDDGYGGDMPTVSGERKEGVYTFLIVGTDKDDGNTDTIMVASYDTVNQTINIMSIPRDTMINESWDLKKINSVYSRTGGNINSLANRVQKLVGFKPDFYVKVDLSVFVELVDLVGGVNFYVPQDMKYDDPYQDLHIDLKQGQQVLDGEKAMQLVRFRSYAEGDIRRVAVQQDFMKALIKECLSLKHWGKIKAYIKLAMDNVQTDLEMGSVIWLAANVLGLNEADALSAYNVNTYTIPGNYWASTWSRATNTTQSYVTIYVNKTIQLVNQCFNPYKQDVDSGMIDAMSILENGDIASSTGVLKDTTHNEVMAVRRGEAYYDEEGNIVYGDPEGEGDEPVLPDDGTITDPDTEVGSENSGDNETETGNENTGDTDTGSVNTGDTDTGSETGDVSGNEGDDPVDNGNAGSEDAQPGDDGDSESGDSSDDQSESGDEPTIPDEPDEPEVPENSGDAQ